MNLLSDSVINFVKSALENPDIDLEVDENNKSICNLLDIFLNISFTEIKQYRIAFTSLCLTADLINGKLSIFSETESEDVEKYLLNDNHIYNDVTYVSKLFVQSYFTLKILMKLLEQNNKENEGYISDDDDNCKGQSQDDLTQFQNNTQHVQDRIADLIYDAVLLENLSDNFKNVHI